jgi:hypothetical protein
MNATDGGRDNLFGETAANNSRVKFGSPHWVDFGQNMEYSPDGKAYLVGHGATSPQSHQAWMLGDEVYMARVVPTVANIADRSRYEFFAGGAGAEAKWVTGNVSAATPLLNWTNHTGVVTMSYFRGLRKYVMVLSTVSIYPFTNRAFDTYFLESDSITGPWSYITYMRNFGPEAYFVNHPTKFLAKQADTATKTFTAFLMYSANFACCSGVPPRPANSGYHMNLQLARFNLSSAFSQRLAAAYATSDNHRREQVVPTTLKLDDEATAQKELTATVHTDETHPVSPLYLGCHSDSGFVHQPRGFYAQMVVGESFEQNIEGVCDPTCWTYFKDPDVQASVALSDSPKFSMESNHSVRKKFADCFHGQHCLSVTIQNKPATPSTPGNPGQPGSPIYHGGAGARNRGLGNEGFHLLKGKQYEGYLHVKSDNGNNSLVVSLEGDTLETLASQEFPVVSTNNTWVRFNFTLVPNASTTCSSAEGDLFVNCGTYKGLPAAGHACIKCGGGLKLTVTKGSMDMDYVVLMPGAWNRLADKSGKPLPVLKSGADVLRKMGTRVIRQGGSFATEAEASKSPHPNPNAVANHSYYEWQKWTGPPECRASAGAWWANTYMSGWG